ncbi:MAG: sigma-70 family RNA polymerase sigma factor [Planctomycetota bacterium]
MNPTLTTEQLLAEMRWLERLARRLCADPSNADDLVQDTLVAALRQRPAVAHPRAWLSTVARRLWRHRTHREAQRQGVERSAARAEAQPSAAQLVEKARLHRSVVEAVVTLEEPYRETLLLRFLEDLPLRDVARRTGVPAETARTRIKRALARLQARLDREHGNRAAWALPLAVRHGAAVSCFGVFGMSWSMTHVGAAAASAAIAALLLWQGLRHGSPEAPATPAALARPATLQGHAPVPSDTPAPPAADPRALIDVAAAPAAPAPRWTVHGTAIEEATGRPLAGATIRWTQTWPEGGAHPAAGEATTDRAGRFELPTEEAEPWQHLELVVTAPGLARVEQALSAPPLTTNTRIDVGEVLVPPGTGVRGIVRDADGAPVADAALLALRHWVYTPTASGISYRVPRLRRATRVGTSRPDGTFQLDTRLLPRRRDERLLAVGGNGLGWASLALSRERAERVVEISMRPSAPLTVVVRDAEGAPVADADVLCEPRFQPLAADTDRELGLTGPLAALFAARTDANGVARLAALPLPEPDEPARYSVRVATPSTRLRHRGIDLRQEADVQVVLADERGYGVRGTVRDPAGRPLPGIRVVAVFGAERQATTGPDGAYELAGLPGDTGTLSLRLAGAGYTTYEASHRLAEPDRVLDLDVELHPAAPIYGVVEDQHGQPIAAARVSRPAGAGNDGSPALATVTDDAGRFRLEGAAIDTDHPLWIQGPGAHFRTAVEHVARPADSPLALVLQRTPRGRTKLRATLHDADGEPLDPGRVRLLRVADRHGLHHPVTGTLGRITAADLTTGEWELVVRPPRGHALRHRFHVADGDPSEVHCALTQRPAARLDGTVVLEAGETAAGPAPQRIQLHFGPGQRARFAAPDGTPRTQAGGRVLDLDPTGPLRFTVVDIDPSRDLIIEAGGTDPWGGSLRIRAGAGASVDARLVVQPNGRLVLRSTTPWPTDGLVLHLRRPGEDWREPLHVGDRRGRDQLLAYPLFPGRWEWRVEVAPEGRSNRGPRLRRDGTLDLASGAAAVVTLDPRR